MDKQTFGSWGGLVALVVVLSLMIGFATPFANLIKDGSLNFLDGFGNVANNAMDNIGNGGGGSGSGSDGGSGVTPPDDTETLDAGLYNADGNLIASWGALTTTYGMNCEKNYNFSSYKTDTASPYYVLTNNEALKNGKILVIGEVTSIGEYAFRECTSLTSIEIPDSVTSIGLGAFYKCSSLTSIEIPDSVTSIGDSAFSNCTALEYNKHDNALYLGNESNPYRVLMMAVNTDITSCNIHNGVQFINHRAFINCTSLAEVEIPGTVTAIGSYAFGGCTSLESITIPGAVTAIGDYAFKDCTSLESITIPASVTTIGYEAFINCTSLASATFENAEGWRRADSPDYKIPSTSLADASIAATCLTSTYVSWRWSRD